ncbi:MAG TPA: hypothetical protein VK530_20320 [Candidatus Acidoferrum sp.]|nr:hypothetical protein [Candidatus Acidoferrum sp.]
MNKKQIRPIARMHGYWLNRTLLKRMAEWSVERQRAFVFDRLQRTLIRAAEGSPFYQERFRAAGFDPRRHFQSASDLQRVPLLTKEDVRGNYEQMIDRRFLARSVEANTSGTSGQPMLMRLNEWYVALDYACMFRFWGQAGYRFRDRYAAVRSYVPCSEDEPLWKFNWWQNTLYMSAYHLKPSNAAGYLDALLRFRPQYIRGYASSLTVLAEYAFAQRARFDFVRGLFTASETLLPSERSTIERTFGNKLFDWYGMTEPAVVITERADHTGMEVNWEYGFPEFAASSELPVDERRLIATSLHNPVMPFIRYDTGDIVKLATDEPPSGELYPLVRAVIGRKDDCILTPDGARLPSLNFYSLLQSYTDVLRFQFVQASLRDVLMKVTLRSEVSKPDELLSSLRREVSKRLGDGIALRVEVTETFETSPDGKSPTFKRAFSPGAETPATQLVTTASN